MNLLRIGVHGFRNDFHSLVPSKGRFCLYALLFFFLENILRAANLSGFKMF